MSNMIDSDVVHPLPFPKGRRCRCRAGTPRADWAILAQAGAGGAERRRRARFNRCAYGFGAVQGKVAGWVS